MAGRETVHGGIGKRQKETVDINGAIRDDREDWVHRCAAALKKVKDDEGMQDA